MAQKATVIVDLQVEGQGKVTRAEQSLREMDVAAVEASEGVGRLERAAEELGGSFAENTRRAERALASYRQQVQRTTQETVTMRSSVQSSANNLGFELVQATQDAKFGMAGVANQIPLMTEQFTQLQAKTGSTVSALKALGSSLVGPAGIVGAITLLLTFQDEIVSFFSDAEESARGATDAFKDAVDAVFAVQEVETPEALSGRTAQEQLQTTRNLIEVLREEAESLREQRRRARGIAAMGTFTPEDRQRLQNITDNILPRLQQREQNLNDALRRRREIFNQIIRRRGTLRRQIETVEPEDQVITPDEITFTEDLTSQLSGVQRKLFESAEEASKIRKEIQRINTEESKQLRSQQAIITALKQRLRLREQLVTLSGRLRRARVSPRGAVGAQPTTLQTETGRQFRSAQGTQRVPNILQRATQRQKEALTQQFNLAQKEAQKFGSVTRQEIGRVVSAAGQLGSALVSAFQSGKKEAEDIAAILLQGVGGLLSAIPGVGQVAGPLLASAGQVVGSFQHGGTVDTPLQIVGERGPELAALPQGSRVSSEQETRRMLQEVTGGQQQGAVVQKLDEVASRVEALEVNLDPYAVTSRLNDIEQEKNEFTAT